MSNLFFKHHLKKGNLYKLDFPTLTKEQVDEVYEDFNHYEEKNRTIFIKWN